MDELAKTLIQYNISISSVESFTVGGFANRIGSISGISAVYRGSLVSYQTRIKRDVLHIDEKIIEKFRCCFKRNCWLNGNSWTKNV